ncbi:MAG: hypothetical protein HC808_17065 [Candidatus Competibacteraceae bacterium]|nr:hypothetical protein [Candidatus Competibacteraceae bacterium]
MAAHEGFAHLYAASVWNDPSEPDCAFRYYLSDYDFDHDGTVEAWENEPWVSCAGSWPNEIENGVLSAGYIYLCEDTSTSSVPHDNRGVEYDWLRALWNLHTNENVSFTDIFRIWDKANPHNWDGQGDGVFEALEDAAYDVFVGDDGGDAFELSLFELWEDLTHAHGLRR